MKIKLWAEPKDVVDFSNKKTKKLCAGIFKDGPYITQIQVNTEKMKVSSFGENKNLFIIERC